MVALEWPLPVLRSAGARVGTVRNVHAARCVGPDRHGKEYLASSFTIYAIWSLVHYRAVLYMDTDLQVMHSLDHLFDAMATRPEVQQMGRPSPCRATLA